VNVSLRLLTAEPVRVPWENQRSTSPDWSDFEVKQIQSEDSMKRVVQLVVVFFLTSPTVFAAESLSGYLVDSKCYEVTQRLTAGSTSTVELDMELAIKQCAPNPTTKSFGVVQNDWEIVNLDSAGNEKAAELLRQNLKKDMYRVAIVGEEDRKTLKVDSVSMAK
jgi:hypothetical protein